MKKDYFILFILIFYLFFQLSTLDYGFKIKDIQYFKNISLNSEYIKSFTQKKIIKNKENINSQSKSWKYRYKLYSVNADEMMPIMSLSKINIKKGKLDPQLYKYGGAFIYPLGFYYYSLAKINLIDDINFISIIKNEKLMDEIYFNGRLFILISFIFSALIFYNSLKLITKKKHAIIFTLIYLFVPSSIMYSQIIKPNWYALLWFNLSIFFGLKYLLKEKKKYFLFLVSVFLGLAIGSSILFIPSLFFILFFIYFKKDEEISKKKIIFLVTVSFLVFFITNPYILINFVNFFNEISDEHAWVIQGIKLKNIILFFHNSFFLGFGLILSLTLFYYLLNGSKKLIGSTRLIEKRISIGIFFLILFGAIISGFDDWHIQFRYIPYILPISLIYLAHKIKNYKFIFFIFFATIFQTIPLKLAFYDENSSKFSTRLNSANWINKNIIEKEKSVCNKDFSPFDFPPVNFNKIIIKKKCDYEVHVLRQPKKISGYNEEEIVKIFEPRYQFKKISLVFSHVNPLIIIVKK